MRARQPDTSGSVARDGVTVGYDVYGAANRPTIVLLPTWAIAGSEHWKAQVPVLARRHRVVVVHGRGTGPSDRPTEPRLHRVGEQGADVLAVLDATSTQRAVLAGVSMGAVFAVSLAASAPERVTGLVLVAPALSSLAPPDPGRPVHPFLTEPDGDEGWALFNEHVWRRDLRRFAEFFWGQVFSEPHSSKQIEDGVGWSLATGAETLVATQLAPDAVRSERDLTEAVLAAVRCPVLVVHGTGDAIVPVAVGEAVAALTGGDLLLLEGCGHCPQARDPVRVNRALVEFVERVTPAADRPPARHTWTRALDRPRRLLYLSSPIGLGHARRDLAIVRALRELDPALRVDWLTQDPVTRFLDGAGEHVHPASGYLASESGHFTAEAHEHELNAFQAVRRMDEIMVANFAVFQDVVDEGDYDVVVGDEAWDVDHFWHENPELKRSAYAWMTDFVGWLPMPAGGPREAALTADYNSEMIEHVERFRRVRDRAVFVGDPEDVVPGTFGPELPSIRAWTEQHFAFSGYVTGFEPPSPDERRALRRRLGYEDGRPVALVTVGGSGVGEPLLRRVLEAFPHARKEADDLRMVVVAGPRIDAGSLPRPHGVEVRGYVEDLHLHLAACDVAVVQGGLTTSMELVASGRPFVYVPLGDHFEQQRHVRHRLERHRAGRRLDHDADAEEIAAALVEQLGARIDYLPVPTDGARRAAALVADLL